MSPIIVSVRSDVTVDSLLNYGPPNVIDQAAAAAKLKGALFLLGERKGLLASSVLGGLRYHIPTMAADHPTAITFSDGAPGLMFGPEYVRNLTEKDLVSELRTVADALIFAYLDSKTSSGQEPAMSLELSKLIERSLAFQSKVARKTACSKERTELAKLDELTGGQYTALIWARVDSDVVSLAALSADTDALRQRMRDSVKMGGDRKILNEAFYAIREAPVEKLIEHRDLLSTALAQFSMPEKFKLLSTAERERQTVLVETLEQLSSRSDDEIRDELVYLLGAVAWNNKTLTSTDVAERQRTLTLLRHFTQQLETLERLRVGH